jgi:DNA-binding beta-propeller fold protein YncE
VIANARRFCALLLAFVGIFFAGCGREEALEDRGGADTGPAKEQAPPERPPPAPEPAESPPLEREPAGAVIDLGSHPEGLAADPETGLVAVGLREPARLAIVDGENGEVSAMVDLPAKARHLALVEPGGPVLAPAERADVLVRVGLPGGEVVGETPVGDFPHDAAAFGERVFVVNEFESTASVIEAGEVVEVFQTPFQPGGVAVTGEGLVGIVGVRGLELEVFEAESLRSLGRVGAGEGPTHVVAGPDDRFYIADTRGGAVLVYEVGPGLRRTERIPLPGGSPYGIDLDPERNELWVTLTARNRVLRYDLERRPARKLAEYPTVRQPNSVAVDPAGGRVYVTGTRDGRLQVIYTR